MRMSNKAIPHQYRMLGCLLAQLLVQSFLCQAQDLRGGHPIAGTILENSLHVVRLGVFETHPIAPDGTTCRQSRLEVEVGPNILPDALFKQIHKRENIPYRLVLVDSLDALGLP